jgi:hypothetical protein
MDENAVRSEERKRLANALRRYFEDGPSTYRGLLDYIEVDYSTGMHEGWLEFNNAVVVHDGLVASGEREG